MKKILTLVLTAVLLLAALPAFAEAETYTIAYATHAMDAEYWVLMERGVAQACEDYGVTYLMQCHNRDESLMVSTCQNFLQQDIDGLIISPAKPEALTPIIMQAHAQNIPVVIADMGDGGNDDDGFVLTDNYLGGQMAAEYALAHFAENPPKSKQVAVIRLNPEVVVAQERSNASVDTMTAAGYECVIDLQVTTGTVEIGYETMQDILAAHPDISAVFCGNDRTAVGAATAAQDAGITDILITGFDADSNGIEGIKQGTVACTVQQFSFDIGYTAVETMLSLLKGEVPAYSDAETKTVYIAPTIISIDNLPENSGDLVISSSGRTHSEVNWGT